MMEKPNAFCRRGRLSLLYSTPFGFRVTVIRAGEMTADEIEKLVAIIQNPRQFKIPDWFLNRQKDWKTGKTTQISSQVIDQKLREDIERLKKIRYVRPSNLYGKICIYIAQ